MLSTDGAAQPEQPKEAPNLMDFDQQVTSDMTITDLVNKFNEREMPNFKRQFDAWDQYVVQTNALKA